MAKRKTCFVTDWVDDTPALGPNGDAGQRPFLIREDTSTFFARRIAPVDMDG
jgi:hypothetical protein